MQRLFKKAHADTKRQGLARLAYEQMVKRAERKLFENRRKKLANIQNNEVKAEALAEELFHKPGKLLTSEEFAHMYQESECLEIREEMEVQCNFPTVNEFRTIDGTCNNLENPLQGATDTPFARLTPPTYEDGCTAPHGRLQAQNGEIFNLGPFTGPRPSARLISEHVIENRTQDEIPFTHLLMQFGQFLDHDLDLGPELEEECENCTFTEICEPIFVPDIDPAFGSGTINNGKCLPLRRSLPACDISTPGSFLPREQINALTSYIDGSMIYGSRESVERVVRAFENGLLRTGPNFPGNQPSLPVDVDEIVACPNRMDCFLCGDVRCNEQFSLSVMHTLWLREHNLCARNLGELNPLWDDERIYQECRRIVGALIQKIVYVDYLPKVMGPEVFDAFVGPYTGYDPRVDASVPNSFATAAYRYGHSLVRPLFDRLGAGFTPLPIGPLNLAEAFFSPDQFRTSLGTDPIMRGWTAVNSRRMDEFMNRVLTTQLFENTFGVGMDLASLNIQRSREHGLAPYPIWQNFCRRVFGIVGGFENALTAVRFLQLYGSLEDLDLWIGGLAEARLPGSLLGPTFACIFGLTFARSRIGDRFYYEVPGLFTTRQLEQIEQRGMSQIICDNSDGIEQIQPDAFLSNQTRVPCSSLPRFDYSVFQEDVCFFRARVRPRAEDFPISVFSRSITSQFIFSSAVVPGATRATFQCMQIQCPTPQVPVDVVAYSSLDNLRTATVTSNNILPTSTLDPSLTGAYRADWPRSQFDARRGGVFFSLQECESSSQIALTFRSPFATAEDLTVTKELEGLLAKKAKIEQETPTKPSKDKKDKVVPDEILKILNTPNSLYASQIEALKNKGKKVKTEEKKVKTEATSDAKLMSELEDALKSLH